MTQPEEKTAALIARLHNELELAKGEAAAFRNRSEAINSEFCSLVCERDAYFAATSKAQDERDEQRARAEKAEAEIAHARSQNAGLLYTADRLRSERDQRGGEAEAFRQERDQAKAELEASKAECLQWRKDIDEERRQVAFRDSMIANMTKQMDESDRDRVRVCNEQRARAEKAEWALEAEVERCIAEKRQGDIYWNEIHEARKKLGETKPEREGGRSLALCVLDIKGLVDALDQDNRELRQRAESADHKVAMLEAEVGQTLRERDEVQQSLGRVQADYHVLLLGTAHGTKCWMDECGWHCGDGCKAKHAKKCVAAMERDQAREQLAVMTKQRDSLQWHNDQNYMRGKEAILRLEGTQGELQACREQLAKLEWAGIDRPSTGGPLLAACLLCQGFKDEKAGSRFFTTADRIGHKPGCWFARNTGT